MSEEANVERAYWVAVSQVSHIGPVRLLQLVRHFGDLKGAWAAPAGDLQQVLDQRALASFLAARDKTQPGEITENLARKGIEFITLADERYPERLRHIQIAPPVLYIRGTLPKADQPMVSIVGSRRSTSYGRTQAAEIAGELTGAGVVVVSGLARGIDGAAHQGVLEAGGITIAVMASGVDRIYPPEHESLAERITVAGALLSDYPPGTKPDAPHFPARNRIISGLSIGTVVIEAPKRSGALITVDFAADQGRDVFVLPANVNTSASAGSNALLRSGARAVTSARDILEDLGLQKCVPAEPEKSPISLPPGEQRLLSLLGADPIHFDEVVALAGMTSSEGASLMTMLELKGLVSNVGAQHYISLARRART